LLRRGEQVEQQRPQAGPHEHRGDVAVAGAVAAAAAAVGEHDDPPGAGRQGEVAPEPDRAGVHDDVLVAPPVPGGPAAGPAGGRGAGRGARLRRGPGPARRRRAPRPAPRDRKSTRLNSSHVKISYAVFCLKKKTKKMTDKT